MCVCVRERDRERKNFLIIPVHAICFADLNLLDVIIISIHLFSIYPFKGTTYRCGNSHNVMVQSICYIMAVKL